MRRCRGAESNCRHHDFQSIVAKLPERRFMSTGSRSSFTCVFLNDATKDNGFGGQREGLEAPRGPKAKG